MACCLMAPSHYLNQCWLLISDVLWHSLETNLHSKYPCYYSVSVNALSFGPRSLSDKNWEGPPGCPCATTNVSHKDDMQPQMWAIKMTCHHNRLWQVHLCLSPLNETDSTLISTCMMIPYFWVSLHCTECKCTLDYACWLLLLLTIKTCIIGPQLVNSLRPSGTYMHW